MKIILASKSPRRQEMLRNLGLDFQVVTCEVDEISDTQDPRLRVEELAYIKGLAVVNTLEDTKDTLVISGDTLVYAQGEFLGKPKDESDAVRMLSLLSGKKHSVVSGFCLFYNGKYVCKSSSTHVYFNNLSQEEIQSYVDSKEPLDKAGGYAIQGKASLFVKKIEGDYFGVVGFPVSLFYDTLKNDFGVEGRFIIDNS